jgi:hypothetical protein
MRKQVVLGQWHFTCPGGNWKGLCVILFVLSATFCSCRERDSGKTRADANETMLKNLRGAEPMNAEVRQQRLRAIQIFQNGKRDSEPILVSAALSKAEGDSTIHLFLQTYDEDQDVAGFEITEKRRSPDGTPVEWTERYPAFLFRPAELIFWGNSIPVQIREDGDRKDEQKWAQYEKGEGIDRQKMTRRKYQLETLPPVLVSIPEPSVVDVSVRVYDRAGRESNSMALINSIRDGPYAKRKQ